MAWLIETVWLLTVAMFGCTDASRYAVVLLGLDIQTPAPWTSDNTYELLILNPGTVDIDVEIKNISGSLAVLSVKPDAVATLSIDAEYSMNGTEHANKTLLVSSNDTFTLQVFSSSPTHAEGYMAIPMESLLGPHQIQNVYEYVVSTYCASSGYCQMALAAFETAEVKFTFPANLLDDVVFCVGKKYFRSKRDRRLILEKFHAVQLETTKDLSGMHIYSFSPFVVFVGARNISVTGGIGHTVEQLVPASQWGNRFAVAPLGENDFGDVLRISTTWPNTQVDLSGYQSFVISKSSDIVTRRLEKDSVLLITANHPIQVLQITGVTFATGDESLPVAMVIVPAIEHATDVIKITCGSTAGSGKFHVVSERENDPPSVNGISMSDEKRVDYSPYKIMTRMGTRSVVYEVSGTRFSGVVTCQNNAVFPMSPIHSLDAQDDEADGTPAETFSDATCIDGASGIVPFDRTSHSALEYDDFGRFSVLKLRTMVCGEALLTMRANDGIQIYFRLTAANVIATVCTEYCAQETVHEIEDTFNSARHCSKDMAWYWVRVIKHPSAPILCFGFGPVVNTDDTCQGAPFKHTSTDGSLIFDSFLLAGIFAEAYFNYDLETDVPCNTWVSSWRCADKIRNCSSYGTAFCTDTAYTGFSTDVCPKYCGKCTVDGYGRKFVIPTPPGGFASGIIVTPLDEVSPRIGVATADSVVTQFTFLNTHGSSLGGYVIGLQQETSELVWIIADKDIAVTVYQHKETDLIKHHYKIFNAYPVDGFSTDFLIFTGCDDEYCICQVVTEDTMVEVVPYSQADLKLDADLALVDGLSFTVHPYTIASVSAGEPGALNKGTQLRADRPFGVFCGGGVTGEPVGFIQMVPMDSYGTLYRLPELNFGSGLQNFTLFLQAVKPNTTVTIKADSDLVYTLESMGQIISITINAEVSYEVESNIPFAVALGFVAPDDEDHWKSSFIVLPPVNSYIRKPVVFSWFNNLEQIAYVSKTGETELVDDPTDRIGAIEEEKFGIAMFRQQWYLPFILPSFSSLALLTYLENLCVTSTAVVEDGIDNDCDGLVDEDLCSTGYGIYGKDGDLDGDFGVDCGGTISEPVIVPNLPEPTCFPLGSLFNHQLTICSCPCWWLDKFEAYQQLTPTERETQQADRINEIREILKIDHDNLTSSKSAKISAVDERKSAASIGYIGICIFALVFVPIVLMDLRALYRDLRTMLANLRVGVRKLGRCMNR